MAIPSTAIPGQNRAWPDSFDRAWPDSFERTMR